MYYISSISGGKSKLELEREREREREIEMRYISLAICVTDTNQDTNFEKCVVGLTRESDSIFKIVHFTRSKYIGS